MKPQSTERPSDLELRPARPADDQAIRDLTYAAFQNHPHHRAGAAPSEHLIMGQLRDAGALTLSLVAERGGRVVGHLAVSPVEIGAAKDQGNSASWFGLGPVAVTPGLQKQGIGAALIEAGLHQLRDMGATGCVVLGDPGYYFRFGFAHDPALAYPGPPAAYFQRLRFEGPMPAGTVSYHPAFGG